jgi:hypothetical protein
MAAPQPRNESGTAGLTNAVDDAAFCGTITSVHAGGLMSSHPAPHPQCRVGSRLAADAVGVGVANKMNDIGCAME